jgi:hypothetical protein
MEKKNRMSNRDKVAMILTTYGFSLEEGMKMYDTMTESENHYLVVIDRDNDCVVWLERYDSNENGGETITLSIWHNYRKDFCDNYALVGAVAIDDKELDVSEDKDKFMDFFRQCAETDYNIHVPLLADDLRYIFTLAALSDYMDYDSYEIYADTEISVKTTAKPVY